MQLHVEVLAAHAEPELDEPPGRDDHEARRRGAITAEGELARGTRILVGGRERAGRKVAS